MPRLALYFLVALVLSGCSAREFSWTETPVLSDGSTLTVERSIELDYDNMMKVFAEDPHEYSLFVRHPKSGSKIEWHGGRGVAPIQLEIVENDAYLVVMPQLCDADLSSYGNPRLPYVALKLSGEEWRPIVWEERPAFLARANLYFDWRDGEQASERPTVEHSNEYLERLTKGHFQVEFPSSFEDWTYAHKEKWGAPCGSRNVDLRKLPHWKQAVSPPSPNNSLERTRGG
jgi:hypothetical protein